MEVTKEVLEEISDQLDFGLRCFVHIKTHEVVSFPDAAGLMEADSEIWEEQMEKRDEDFDNFKEIMNMSSSESFKIMEAFVDTVNDNKLKAKLVQALEGRKPFANFKHQIDNSDSFRKKWFAFKSDKLNEWVLAQLKE